MRARLAGIEYVEVSREPVADYDNEIHDAITFESLCGNYRLRIWDGSGGVFGPNRPNVTMLERSVLQGLVDKST